MNTQGDLLEVELSQILPGVAGRSPSKSTRSRSGLLSLPGSLSVGPSTGRSLSDASQSISPIKPLSGSEISAFPITPRLARLSPIVEVSSDRQISATAAAGGSGLENDSRSGLARASESPSGQQSLGAPAEPAAESPDAGPPLPDSTVSANSARPSSPRSHAALRACILIQHSNGVFPVFTGFPLLIRRASESNDEWRARLVAWATQESFLLLAQE